MNHDPFDFRRLSDAWMKYGIEVRKTPADTIMVILNELPGQRGASVATVIEHLATDFYQNYLSGVPAWQVVWVLRYPPRETAGGPAGEAYDQVVLEWDGRHFRSPKWIPLPRESWETFGLGG